MSLIHNERTKLTAAWLNTIAAGSIIAGVVAPSVSLTLVEGVPPVRVFLFSLVWLLAGIGLHFVARNILKRLLQ
jgi:hypothetical protein